MSFPGGPLHAVARLRQRQEWQFFAVLSRADRNLAAAWWAVLACRGVLPAVFAVATGALADLIVVLDGARLVEVGSHQRLLAAGGQYAELYGIQAAAYRTPPAR
jgi:ABC-type multidrug transport system fused ATPase/permease subunit